MDVKGPKSNVIPLNPTGPSTTQGAVKGGDTSKAGDVSQIEKLRNADGVGHTVSQEAINAALEKIAFDPVEQLPPHGDVGTSTPVVMDVAATLKACAENASNEQLKRIFETASKACLQTAKMAQVATPVRVTLKEDPKRPSVLSGVLKRRIKGSGANRKSRLQFRPNNRDFSPFPIPAEMVEGLPSGARLDLKLDRTEDGKQQYKVVARETEYSTALVGKIVVEDGKAFVQPDSLLSPYSKVPLINPDAIDMAGQSVRVDVLGASDPSRVGTIAETYGKDSPKEKFMQFAADAGRPLSYPADVMREVAQLKANPKIEGGKDFRALPFCTIDNDDSMDLDQAMCIKPREDGGYDVHYAIADTTHFIKPGGAIDKWAQRIGLTTYLPHDSLPILPKVISEDLCSLVEGEDRRAFVISAQLDKDGNMVDFDFARGLIHSVGKLSYNRVQDYHDKGQTGPYADKGYTESLDLLKTVGDLRIDLAAKRGVVPSDAGESRIQAVDKSGTKFDFVTRQRNHIEKCNEQISLLANEAIARGMAKAGLQSLHRIHPEPEPARVDMFRDKVAALGVPWKKEQGLDDYIRALDDKDPKTKVILRLASRINKAARYGAEKGGHSALKLEFYDHFTAPMRRLPDIISARIFAAHLEGKPVPFQGEGELDKLADRMDAAKRREGEIASNCRKYMTAHRMQEEVGNSINGTIVDVHPGGVVVELDNPPVEVLLTPKMFQELGQGGAYTLNETGTSLSGPAGEFKMGNQLKVSITDVDVDNFDISAAPTALLQTS